MCTASWLFEEPSRGEGGFELFFNRDESRQRRRALPPRRDRAGGVEYLAPVDADAGGTWIAVNEYGLALGLLNLYGAGEPASRGAADDYRSRGLLVQDLIALPALEQVAARLGEVAGADFPYRYFRLLALAPGARPGLWVWDGARLARQEDPRPPLASSGYDPGGIEAVRRQEWEESVGEEVTGERLLAFHRDHRPERGPYSPCMHRADASTVSFTWVRVGADAVSMAYSDGPPCRAPLVPALTLARRAVPSPDRHATLA